MAYSFYDDANSVYRSLVNGFNEYSKENGLGIYVHLTMLTPENSTFDFENYGTTIDSLLSKQSQKYDMFFYYSAYTKRYGDHFLNIRKHIPKEYIEQFDEKLLNETCSSYDNKLIGLVI